MDNYYQTQLSVHYNHRNIPAEFPRISKPHIIGFYSVNGDRSFVPTAENLRYLKLPKLLRNLKFDLNRGYENVIHKPESFTNEKIDNILQFIIKNKAKLLCNNKPNVERNTHQSSLLNCDFISFRGVLRLIMSTPYENKDDWCILATKYRGNIYLCQMETSQKKQQRLNETDEMRRILSYGLKFEQYVFKDDPAASVDDDGSDDEPVNESKEFACGFRTDLEGMKLLYVAEIDGIKSDTKHDIDSNTDLNKFELVEVKVKLREKSHYQERNFYKFKLRNWWCQCFLVGIKKTYVGLRNDKGIVDEIQVINIREALKLSKEFWSPVVCMDFLRKFLLMVKNHLHNIDCPNTVYEYYWDPKLYNRINYKIHEGRSDLTFLPDWYIMRSKNKFQ